VYIEIEIVNHAVVFLALNRTENIGFSAVFIAKAAAEK